MFNSLDCFYVVNKTLWLKTRADMYAKISMFVICVEAIIYLLLYNLHSVHLFCAGWSSGINLLSNVFFQAFDYLLK